MRGKVSGLVLLLVFLLVGSVLVSAADNVTISPPPITQSVQQQQLQNAINTQVDQANRYLAAETVKAIDSKMEDLKKSVNDYNDQNFQLFDGRMTKFMDDTRVAVMVGGVGAILLAMGIVGIFLMRAWRRYSFEYYQEQIIKKQQADISDIRKELEGIRTMQQQSWEMQQPQQTLGMKYGQADVSNMTQMNAWQMQPAYEGSWKSPEVPENKSKEQHDQWNAQWGGQGG